jgi:Cu/Ag efflux protein CusF
MKPRNLISIVCAVCLLLAVGAVGAGEDQERPHKGKVISLDKDAMSMGVQGEKNDQWTLYWTESTQLKGDVTVQELQVGDKVHFKFVEKDGKKWVTELHRSEKAGDDD